MDGPDRTRAPLPNRICLDRRTRKPVASRFTHSRENGPERNSQVLHSARPATALPVRRYRRVLIPVCASDDDDRKQVNGRDEEHGRKNQVHPGHEGMGPQPSDEIRAGLTR